jgi:hypothetical protein
VRAEILIISVEIESVKGKTVEVTLEFKDLGHLDLSVHDLVQFDLFDQKLL